MEIFAVLKTPHTRGYEYTGMSLRCSILKIEGLQLSTLLLIVDMLKKVYTWSCPVNNS